MGRIGSTLNISKATVQTVILKYNKTGSVENVKPKGRPKKLSPTAERVVCRYVRKSRRTSMADITAHVNKTRFEGCTVSSKTIRRILHRHKIMGRAAAKKLQLSPTVRLARLRWCRSFASKDTMFWKSIVFSDEMRVGLHSDGRIWVWRGPRERFRPECTIPRNRQGKSIMYWGYMTDQGCGPLIRCTNKMNAAEYVNIMEQACVQAICDFQKVYMDDNAPVHRAISVRSWKEQWNVQTIDWPAYSPDLNPIENVWSYIKAHLNRLHERPGTLDELDAAVRNLWNLIPVSMLDNLYGSMRGRLRSCIRKRGFPTKY
jgi:transposase